MVVASERRPTGTKTRYLSTSTRGSVETAIEQVNHFTSALPCLSPARAY